jgi:DNA-binding winged helix-turn-helix (wHTH) protein
MEPQIHTNRGSRASASRRDSSDQSNPRVGDYEMNAAIEIAPSAPHAVPFAKSGQPAGPGPVRVRFGAFELDESNALLLRNGKAVTLAPKPFAVLCALAGTACGSLVTKNALLDLVWGHRFVTESVLKSAISEVRAALDDDPKQPCCIETVSRRGYRFIAATTGASSQRVPAIARNVAAGRDHPALVALTALCRGDAALADLIRSLAATLEPEALVLQ